MSFQTRCPFCQQHVRVPDQALGGSGKCPRCHCYFTLAPNDQVGQPATSQGATPAAMFAPLGALAKTSAATPTPLPTAHESSASATSATQDEHDTSAETRLRSPRASSLDRCLQGEVRRGIGALAVLLGGGGLICASVGELKYLTVPMSSAGCLLGLYGLFSNKGRARVRAERLLFAGGVGVGGSVLAAAWLAPQLLGPIYQAYRQDDSDRLSHVAVSANADPKASTKNGDDWVDARRGLITHGRALMTIGRVWVGSGDQPGTISKKTTVQGLQLFVQLTLIAQNQSSTPEGDSSEKLRSDLKPSPKIVDNQGRSYKLRDQFHLVPKGKAGKTTDAIAQFRERVFVFDAPPPDVSYLRLEIPAALWGDVGAVRVSIPSSMIKRDGPESATIFPGDKGRGLP